jgi:hypothetical protein
MHVIKKGSGIGKNNRPFDGFLQKKKKEFFHDLD